MTSSARSALVAVVVAVATMASPAAYAQTTTMPDTKRDTHFADNAMYIKGAAMAAMEVYESEFVETAEKEAGVATSAVLLKEDDDDGACYIAFRGAAADMGFGWVADMTLGKAIVKSRDPTEKGKAKNKKCKVIREFQKEYKQEGYEASYTGDVTNFVQGCAEKQMPVIFTGHSYGGALATVWGVAYEYLDMELIVTFAQPPVFMPSKQKKLLEEPTMVKGVHGLRVPCKYISGYKYIPIINTENSPDGGVGLVYDFMYYLPTLIYTMAAADSVVKDELVGLDCLVTAAEKIAKQAENKNKNLGGKFGMYLKLPPTGTLDSNSFARIELPTRKRRYKDFAEPAVTADMLAVPSSGTCEAPDSTSPYSMAEYMRKLENLGTFASVKGFAFNSQCNFESECIADCVDNICVDPGGRNARPGMK